MFIGLAIMAALVTQGYQDILLAGAVGGILSRLQRELLRRDVPSDYGLSWSVLFLSPVSGALSAWAGLLLLQTLQKFNVIDLKTLLPDNVDLTAPTGAILGAAVVFGISERMLDRLVRQAEDEIAAKPHPDGVQSIGEQPPAARRRSSDAGSRRPPPPVPDLRARARPSRDNRAHVHGRGGLQCATRARSRLSPHRSSSWRPRRLPRMRRNGSASATPTRPGR